MALFLTVSCESDDDDFYNTIHVLTDNLVTIETQSDYEVGDFLKVTADVPRLITEAGQANQLDVRASTGNASHFVFSYYLERKNAANEWEFLDLTGNVVVNEGSGTAGSFVQAQAVYNGLADAYLFDGDIELMQPGAYRLTFGSDMSANRVELVSASEGNNITLNISSTVVGADNAGSYYFTVN